MWPPWSKSPSQTPTRISSFSHSTFKDIPTLFPTSPKPQPPSPSLFHRVRLATKILRAFPVPPPPQPPPGIVIYFTSLRIVRKTFEDCRTVRSILRSFRVPLDERDLSMDSIFSEELRRLVDLHTKGGLVNLPSVFIGGKYIGGADEVRQLHECGELKKLVQEFDSVENGVCEECGGLRFVLCYQCDGSHKIYLENGGGGFRSCFGCNKNGLIRCPTCSSLQTKV